MIDTRKKILVMDRDLEQLTIIGRRLEFNGFDVILTEDGAQGLNLSREYRPDLVIMDIMTPNLPGRSAVQTFGPQRIPILFLKDMPERYNGLEEGVVIDGVLYPTLHKPFFSGDLVDMVKGILEKEPLE